MVTSTEAVKEGSRPDALELARSIHDVIGSLLRQIQPTVEQEKISKGQFLALHVLSNISAVSVSTMAKHLAVTAPTVCVTLDQLEAVGLVTRERSSRDRRTVEVSLTPKGRKVEARIWARIERRLATAVADLPPEDIAATLRVFHKLNQRLARGAEPAGEKA